MSAFRLSRPRRTAVLAATTIGVTAATVLSMAAAPAAPGLPGAAKELLLGIQGTDQAGGAGGETGEIKAAIAQFNDARNAPGFAIKGGYDSALNAIGNLGTPVGGSWQPVTNIPYNADDTRYRDYPSNSSGGADYVTGRAQALATDGTYLYAGGASGGVARIKLSGGAWQTISDDVPALASGALLYTHGSHELWYATGDGATGSTTYVGDGVWVTSDPTDTNPTWHQVGDPGNILNGAVIQRLALSKDGKTVYAPTSYGVYSHPTASSSWDQDWTPVWQPHPDFLPTDTASDPSHPSSNWVSDIALDPRDPDHMVAAFGWVVGGAENGWYDGRKSHGTWTFTEIKPSGAIPTTDIGRTTFAYAADGSRLYALVHNPDHAAQGISYSELGGVFVSKTGSPLGPWSKIADSHKLANSGSALDPTIDGAGSINGGYQPGVQAWYNQFLAVDPTNPDHLFVGLEEVYETLNGGSSWRTTGPYWNFYFPCWGQQIPLGSACPIAPHSDQHAALITGGKLYIGNDGGVYSWPLDGRVNSSGHGMDWTSLTKTSTPDFLQYYSVAVGKQTAEALDGTEAEAEASSPLPTNGVIVSGGLQDNGGSILLNGDQHMGSNFGGDGGDSLADPDDGCNIVQEYVELSMSVTQDCASPTDTSALYTPENATSFDIAPTGETNAQFIAPFAADHTNVDHWVAAGQHVWFNSKGFAIRSGDEWAQQIDLGYPNTATSVASFGDKAIVGYCGPCSPTGPYAGGYAIGTLGDPASWHKYELTGQGLPNRWVGGADVYQDARGGTHYLLAFNGFSRRWAEGPGAGVGHVFTSTNGTDWTDISGDLPDVPMSSVKWLGDNRIVVGSDLGTFITSDGGVSWEVLGNGLPLTVVTDVEPGPDGALYAATYGRGIWKLAPGSVPGGALPLYDGSHSAFTAGGTASASGGSGTTKPGSGGPPKGKKH